MTAASRLSGLSARMKPILLKARSHMYRHWRKRCSGNVWATLSELSLAKPRLFRFNAHTFQRRQSTAAPGYAGRPVLRCARQALSDRAGSRATVWTIAFFGSRTKQAVLAGHGGRVDCGDFHRRIAAGADPQLHPSASPSRVTVVFGRHDLAARLGFKAPAPVSVPTEVAWIIANKGADCWFGAEHETGRLAQMPQLSSLDRCWNREGVREKLICRGSRQSKKSLRVRSQYRRWPRTNRTSPPNILRRRRD